MYTVDANIFARDTDPNDAFYPNCHLLLETLDQRQLPIIVPNLVLVEVAAAVSRTRRDPIRARIAAEAIGALEHIQMIALDDGLMHEAIDIAADRGLRGADAIYAAVARRYGCTLISLDREQRERATLIITVQTPEQTLADLGIEPAPPAGAESS